MSQKDFQAIATIIRNRRMVLPFNAAVDYALDDIRSDLADLFEKENPRFDRQRFIEACEPEGL